MKRTLKVSPLRVPFEQIPGHSTALKMIHASAKCRAAVGGKSASKVEEQMSATEFYAYAVVAAEWDDQSQVLRAVYAYSQILYGRIALFPPFWNPRNATLENKKGHKDTIAFFEQVHGFLAGTVDPAVLQALILLHELAHINGTIPDDLDCPLQSMRNTRQIAVACSPDLVGLPLAGLEAHCADC